MSFLVLTLLVLAAVIHATWNLLAKRAALAGPVFVLAYTGIASVVYMPWVVYLILDESHIWSLPVITCIFLSGALHLAYSLFLQRGYQVADLSVVYPVARGSAPMMATAGAFLVLGERPSTWGVAGLIAVVVGIGLISTQGSLTKFRQPAAQKGLRWGGTTGSMIAGYTLVDAFGVKVLAIHPVILDWCANVVRFVMLLSWLPSNRHEAATRMRGKWLLAVAVGVLSPLSYIFVLLALRTGAPLSVVAPAREMSMMVGVLLGMLVLREQVGFWRLFGCLVLIIGVVLLSRV